MLIRYTTYVIPSTDAVIYALRGKKVTVPSLCMPTKGYEMVREIKNSKGEVIHDGYCVVNPNVASYLMKEYGGYDQIRDGYYVPSDKTKKNKVSKIEGHTFVGNTNYYSNCSVVDYISKCTTGKPEKSTHETWANLPLPIAFNTHGADKVVIAREGKELTFAATGNITFIYNFIPGMEYTATVMNGDEVVSIETFVPTGGIRQIYLEKVRNCRDIGGKGCYSDNGELIGTTAFGRIYRGMTLATATSSTMNTLINVLGVDVVIDLSKENSEKLSGVENLLGTTYGWGTKDIYVNAVTNKDVKSVIRLDIETIADRLSKGKNIYVHCEGGMDRTGTICFLLEAICGCSYNDVIQDYEISSMTYSGGLDESGVPCRIDAPNKLLYIIKHLHDNYGKNGETLRQQAIAFLKSINVTDEAIANIQKALVV